jgi:hypothetical protein
LASYICRATSLRPVLIDFPGSGAGTGANSPDPAQDSQASDQKRPLDTRAAFSGIPYREDSSGSHDCSSGYGPAAGFLERYASTSARILKRSASISARISSQNSLSSKIDASFGEFSSTDGELFNAPFRGAIRASFSCNLLHVVASTSNALSLANQASVIDGTPYGWKTARSEVRHNAINESFKIKSSVGRW